MGEIPSDLLNKHPDKEKTQIKILRDILDKNNIPTRQAVVIIGGHDILLQKVFLPKIPAGEIRNALQLQIQKSIDFPIEQAVFDFMPVLSKGGKDKWAAEKSEYQVVVLKREVIDHVLQVAHGAGLDLKSISLVPFALQALFAKSIAKDSTALIYMGKNSTNISIFKDGQFESSREIAIGGEAITQSMIGKILHEGGEFNLDYAAAEKLKMEQGIPVDFEDYSRKTQLPADKIYAMIRPALEKIEAEILRSFSFFGSAIGRAIITGGASNIPHLVEVLNDVLKVPVREAKEVPSQMSAAIGAGLLGSKGINLLPEEYKHPALTQLRKLYNLWTPIGVFFVLLFLVWLGYAMKSGEVTRELTAVRAQAQVKPVLEQPVLPAGMSNEMLARQQQQNRRFIEILGNLDLITPKSILFQSLNYDSAANRIVIRGVALRVKDGNEISKYIVALKANKVFQSIDLSSLKESGSVAGFDFEITCLLKAESLQ
jgi:type IV pilus assembly protein PilM